MSPSSAYKYATNRCTYHVKPSLPDVPSYTAYSTIAIKATQFNSTASATTLKIVGDSGYPRFTPIEHLKGVTKYPPACATIVSWYR